MKRSETRILTTHTGSLPRPDGLVEMLGAVSRGEPVDEAALDAAARKATAEVVAAQLAAGVDVVNNGEQSRVSFSTYVTQRMAGFGGAWTRSGHRDQNEFPSIVRSASRAVDARRPHVHRAPVLRPAGRGGSGNATICCRRSRSPAQPIKSCL